MGNMITSTTIKDLPDDVLQEIFERVFAEESQGPALVFLPPQGAHATLRRVCRRWRDIADCARLSTAQVCVNTAFLADAGAVRVRHPAALKNLMLSDPMGSMGIHSTAVSQATASLIDGSADLRRSLVELALQPCCLPALAPAVTTIAACTALTKLGLLYDAHPNMRVVPSNMLAPLSSLRMLNELVYGYVGTADALPASARLAPLPALPDAPHLTRFRVHAMGNFVPVGSDAALGRLRRLDLWNRAPVQALLDAEDPFLLRTAFDAGTWQPSRLTGLQELSVDFGPASRAPARPSRTGSRAGSEWAPLAGQVTSLIVQVSSGEYKRPSTGIVAGLGALTALRFLHVHANVSGVCPGRVEPVSIDRVQAPHLTYLVSTCNSTPASVARFPNLVRLALESVSPQPPLKLRSLVARSSLKVLKLVNHDSWSPGLVNLAGMFVGGVGWPVLEQLAIGNIALEWDTTGLAGTPTAVEFAKRARQLLPALFHVAISEPPGRGVLPDRSRVGFVVACRRHVVPALLGLRAGGG